MVGSLATTILLLPSVLSTEAGPTIAQTSTHDPAHAAATKLAQARVLFEDLEYERALPLLEAALENPALTPEQRLEAYKLQAMSLAITGDLLAAEAPFRFILRSDPAFDLAPETSPRVLRVLRKVQAEERALAEQLRQQRRRALARTLAIEGDLGDEVPGGAPIEIAYRLRDPRGAVATFRMQYRRGGESDYSALALQRQDDGTWRGDIPAEWTASEAGFDLEYYLSIASADGEPLLSVGEPGAPRQARVTPGTVPDATPFYQTVWFWGVTAGAALAVGGAAWIVYSQQPQLPEGDVPPYELP